MIIDRKKKIPPVPIKMIGLSVAETADKAPPNNERKFHLISIQKRCRTNNELIDTSFRVPI
jgi:hypothetical protein